MSGFQSGLRTPVNHHLSWHMCHSGSSLPAHATALDRSRVNEDVGSSCGQDTQETELWAAVKKGELIRHYVGKGQKIDLLAKLRLVSASGMPFSISRAFVQPSPGFVVPTL